MNSNRFSYFLRVRYGECDAQKVVFNSRYGDYVDLAAAEFLRVLGFEHEIQTAELDYQLVKQTTRVARAGALRPGAGDLGEHEAPGHDVVHAARPSSASPARRLIATSETVYVHVDTHTLKKAPIPARLREALERGAPGSRVDHAALSVA